MDYIFIAFCLIIVTIIYEILSNQLSEIEKSLNSINERMDRIDEIIERIERKVS